MSVVGGLAPPAVAAVSWRPWSGRVARRAVAVADIPSWVWPVAVAMGAFAVRLVPTLTSGGWVALGRYDDAVYFGTSLALVHGQVPYREVLLLHPPGIVILLAPFAALAGVLGDAGAFAVAKVCFMLVGAGTAGGVAWLVRRHGPMAMFVAGATYATFLPSAYADSSISLEAPSNALLVAAIHLLRRDSVRLQVTAGAMLGLTCALKMWGVVPLIVVLGLLRWEGERSRANRLLIGAAGALVATCGPFFVLAPTTMWRMVVLDQLNRPRGASTMLDRLPALFGLPAVHGHGGPRTQLALWLIFLAVATLVILLVRRTIRVGEPWPVVLLLGTIGVLLLSPINYLQYGAFIAVPLAWCAGVALTERVPQLLWLAAAGMSLVAVLLFSPGTVLSPGFLNQITSTSGCITSDDPGALIASNTLSRNLRAGCRTWIDVTGVTYDTPGIRALNGISQPRVQSSDWLELVSEYLESGTAVVFGRPSTGIHPDAIHYWRISAASSQRDQGYVFNVWTAPGGQRPPTFLRWAESLTGPMPWRYGE